MKKNENSSKTTTIRDGFETYICVSQLLVLLFTKKNKK